MTSGSCFTAWEAMLGEAEKEAKTHVELAQKLSQSVANQLSEITARKRTLKKKVRTMNPFTSYTVQTSGEVNISHRQSVCILHPARSRVSSWLWVLCGRSAPACAHVTTSMQVMAINFWAWSSCLKVRS